MLYLLPLVLALLTCDPSADQSYDGKCNNLANPFLGSAYHEYVTKELSGNDLKEYQLATSFIRPEGREKPEELDSSGLSKKFSYHPRTVTNYICKEQGEVKRESSLNELSVFFGQILTHDLTKIILEEVDVTNPTADIFISAGSTERPGLNLLINTDSLSFDNNGLKEQLNGVSAIIDLNPVYGSNSSIAGALRKWNQGALLTLNKTTLKHVYTNIGYYSLCDCFFPNGSRFLYAETPEEFFEITGQTATGFSPEPLPFVPPFGRCYTPASLSGNPSVLSCPRFLPGGGFVPPLPTGVICFINFSNYNSPKYRQTEIQLEGDWQPTLNQIPPGSVPIDSSLERTTPKDEIFVSGDDRNIENVAANLVHQIFLRVHNRRANEIYLANPSLSDEQIYQKARAWTIGIWQNIIYNDYLPAIMGQKAYNDWFGLHTNLDFDPNVDPRTSNLWATAGSRFAHSQVPSSIYVRDPQTKNYILTDKAQIPRGTVGLNLPELDDYLKLPAAGQSLTAMSPAELIAFVEGENNIMTGLIFNLARNNDNQIAGSLQDLVAASCFTEPFLIDVAALDLTRGRRHNLPNYDEVRKKYHPKGSVYQHGKGTLNNQKKCAKILDTPEYLNVTDSDGCFSQFVPKELIGIVKSIYGKVKNIDAWLGMTLEAGHPDGRPSKDSGMSETEANIMGEQMVRTMKADRFFYPRNNRLTNQEKQEISQIKMSTVLRWFYPQITNIPDEAFKVPKAYHDDQKPCEAF